MEKTSPRDRKIIVLVGLMGSGKTTIGLRLAQKIGVEFIDCDREIENRCGKSINAIFSEHSVEYFRQIEEEIINEIINQNKLMVLSLGGGAFISENTRKLVKEKCISIWLDADVDAILERIGSKTDRPLLNNVDKRETLLKLRKEREIFYQEADIKIDSTTTIHDETVDKIIKNVKNLLKFS